MLTGHPMPRAIVIRFPLLTAWVVAVTLSACSKSTAPLNVVLITLDGLRSDHLAIFDYERDTAPNLTRLARTGMVWDRVIPSGCSTKASLTSLYTGLDYSHHGRLHRGDVLEASHVTLAERFSAAGYRTFGFVSTPHVAAQFQYDQGFDHYGDRLRGGLKGVRARIGRFLSQVDEEPFFLYVHLKEPHPPWKGASPWDEGETEAQSFFGEACTYVPDEAELAAVDDSTRRGLVAKYDGEILAADRLLGEIVDGLRRVGSLERTVIGVGTDHGLELLDHFSATHGYSPFEEVVRTFFLLWRGDDSLGGARSSVQARIFDIGPTLMAAAGLAAPDDVDGVDLVGAADRLSETAFTICYNAGVARRGDLKLVHFWPAGQGRLPPGYADGPYLFDLATDPGETHDVSTSHPEAFDQLQRQLWRHLQSGRQLSETSTRLLDEEIDSEVLQQLEALGYVQ